MILVDTSVWVHHLRAANQALVELLDIGRVLGHPFVIGELALGRLRQRDLILDALRKLPQAIVANNDEVLHFIKQQALDGMGIGYLDVHLLASVRLSRGATLWTHDIRLRSAAERLGFAWKIRAR